MECGDPIPITDQTLTLTACFGSSESTGKQATVISVRGAPDDVTYGVSGRYNYEFIGGPELKPDLSVQENPTSANDLAAAVRVQEYLADTVSVAQVMTNHEY